MPLEHESKVDIMTFWRGLDRAWFGTLNMILKSICIDHVSNHCCNI